MVVPRQREFQRDLRIINEALNELIERANATRSESDLADLEARDYDKVKDPSMLRFLVDLRGEEATDKQLRDDLMTMLVAGHETTAAVLTWAAFCLSQVRRPAFVYRPRRRHLFFACCALLMSYVCGMRPRMRNLESIASVCAMSSD